MFLHIPGKTAALRPSWTSSPWSYSIKSVVRITKHNSARVHMIVLTLLFCIPYVLSSYPSTDTEVLLNFPQSLQANAAKIYQIGHDHLFPHIF